MPPFASREAAIGEELRKRSAEVRRTTLEMSYRARSGHIGSAFSIVDLLTSLYFAYLHIDPANPGDPLRDRFILSKGHGCSSLYATLALRGFFPIEDLWTFTKDGSRFAGHPSSHMVAGIEASTGSLGHGLCIGLGMALAGKRVERPYHTVVIISDGECDEGSTWEAVLAAGQWGLTKLRCIVDYNKIQSFGRTKDVMNLEPFADKWRAFNWHVQEVNGHNHREILSALGKADLEENQPSVLIAHTIKGKGVSFMEDTIDWHYWSLNDAQYQQALSELS